MGKKSLLAPTSKENTSSEKSSEKEKKSPAAVGTAKKAAPKPAKKKAAPKPAKKKAPAVAAAKKKAAGSKALKKKVAPKQSPKKKKAPSSKGAVSKSSAKPKAGKTVLDSVSGDFRDKAEAGMKPSIQKPAKPQVEAVPGPSVQTGGDKTAIPTSTTGGGGIGKEEKKAMDPMHKMAAVGLCVLAALLIMVLWASASNVGKFYVKPVDGQLEIWKGRFSPKGVDKIFILSGASMPAELKEVYSKEEAYALIFEGVIVDADALLGTEGIPDFERIRRTLASARPFAVSKEMVQRLQRRLDKIDMMALVYKADVLAGKGTAEDLARARESLEKAMGLNLDEAEKGLIEQKIKWVDQKLEELAED